MKIFFCVALLAVSTVANAEIFGYINNKGGGRIIITQNDCPIQELREYASAAHSYDKDGRMIHGCWGRYKHDKNKIIIYWEDDDTQLYDIMDIHFEDKKNGKENI